MSDVLSVRREFLFLADIRNGNPNGDPSTNQPRRLPNNRISPSFARLKRYDRDTCIAKGQNVLIAKDGGIARTLGAAILKWSEDNKDLLKKDKKGKIDAQDAFKALCAHYPDIRRYGSSLAITEVDFTPKSLTGAVQIAPGLGLHDVHEVFSQGTTVMAGQEKNKQGTLTASSWLTYCLFGWNGIANELNAQITGMTTAEYYEMLHNFWNGIRSQGNTHSKTCQSPRFMVSITNKKGNEHQFGTLLDYVATRAKNGLGERDWQSPFDYTLDISKLVERVQQYAHCIEKVEFDVHPDMTLSPKIPSDWIFMNIEGFPAKSIKGLLVDQVEAK